MDEEEIKSFLERTDDLGARLTGEDKETFTWVVYGYNKCAKLLKETEQKVEEQQKDYLEALRVKHERAYEITKMKEQQKKFMLWLEEESKKIYRDGGLQQKIYKQILQKSKEMLGDNK